MTPQSFVRRRTLLRFGVAITFGNLVWEMAHVPLYTIWQTGTRDEIVLAVLHCTLGDIMIAAACLGGALFVLGGHGWPQRNYARVAATTVAAALCYTVFSEWLNVEVRRSWAYRDLMPTLPFLGTGVTPFVQWCVVPALAFWLARQDIPAQD
jgi:hypothetical protein